MVSSLRPALRSEIAESVWAVYRRRAQKLNDRSPNPLLTKYIELLSIQDEMSSMLIETCEVSNVTSDLALLSYFDNASLRPLLAKARRGVAEGGLTVGETESLESLENLWHQVDEFEYPADFPACLVIEKDSHVDVDHQSSEADECTRSVNEDREEFDPLQLPGHVLGKPQHDPGNDQSHARYHHHPEEDLLACVPAVDWRQVVIMVGDVRFHVSHPAFVGVAKKQVAPPHPPHVDEEDEIEQAQDRVKKSHRGRSTQDRRQPEEKRSVQGQAAQHQVHASDSNNEMNGSLVKCVTTNVLRV